VSTPEPSAEADAALRELPDGSLTRDEVNELLDRIDGLSRPATPPLDVEDLARRVEGIPVEDAAYVEEDSYVSGFAAGLNTAAAAIRDLADPDYCDGRRASTMQGMHAISLADAMSGTCSTCHRAIRPEDRLPKEENNDVP
jgi:hypothetical protein